MLIALAFAHFSSELLLKEQMIIPVKKKRSPTLVISTQNWSILAKFAKKNPAKSAVFYWLFLGEVSPRNFPWNRPIFLRICPWKSFKNWLFSAKIPWNGPIFLRILTFLLRKSPEIARLFREFGLFSRANPANLPLKIPRNVAFFSREISEALTVPWRVFNERVGDFSLLFLRLSFCKLILKYSRESESSFNIGEGNVLHFRIWEISRLLSNNICWRDSWVWDFIVEFNKIAALQIKHTQQQSCWGICSLKCPFLQWFSIRGRISSVGRALDCRAGGHGFGSRARTNTQGLKITE